MKEMKELEKEEKTMIKSDIKVKRYCIILRQTSHDYNWSSTFICKKKNIFSWTIELWSFALKALIIQSADHQKYNLPKVFSAFDVISDRR